MYVKIHLILYCKKYQFEYTYVHYMDKLRSGGRIKEGEIKQKIEIKVYEKVFLFSLPEENEWKFLKAIRGR